jgi:hypothetical protein
MKYIVSLLLAASAISASPVMAAGTADLARANCVKAIMASSAGVSRDALKKFQFNASGSGFLMSGVAEDGHAVSCEAAADGHTLWVHGG